MNNCNHQFISLVGDWDIDKKTNKVVHAQRVICVFCGQVRDVASDGRVIIIKEKGDIKSNQ
jgi:hypothetical protein